MTAGQHKLMSRAAIVVAFSFTLSTLPVGHAQIGTGYVDGFVIETPAIVADDRIPIEAVYRKTPESGNRYHIMGVLHAVRRVPGATIVYASHGISKYDLQNNITKTKEQEMLGESHMSHRTSMLLDPANKEYYFPLRDSSEHPCLCPSQIDHVFLREDVNREIQGPYRQGLWTFAVAFPPLADDISTVDVSISGDGRFIRDVPVGQGALTPMAQPNEQAKQESFKYMQRAIMTGWPYVPDESFFRGKYQTPRHMEAVGDSELPLSGRIVEYVE